MVVFRCTRELLARVAPARLAPVDASTTRLGDWYVGVVRVGQRQFLLAISERTRVPVVVPARNVRAMGSALTEAVRRVLLALGVPEAEVEIECAAMADARFAPTQSRSLLGTINDFTFAIRDRLHDEPETPLDELAVWLADTPIHTAFQGGAPVDVTRELFGLERLVCRPLVSVPVADPETATERPAARPRRRPGPAHAGPLPMEFAPFAHMASAQRCEYLEGAMHVSPAPTPAHQVAVLRIAQALDDYFGAADRDAVVLVGPVAVFLDDRSVAQPDIVVATRRQLSSRGVEGAPQLIVEVVTAESVERDRDIKVRSYAAAQIERYWLVDVDRRTVECLGRRRPPGASTVSVSGGVLAPPDLPGFALRLETLWL